MKAVQIIIRGEVQRVSFREATKRKAEKFGIVGFVKNMPDGTVYIEAEGEEENLIQFIAWCRKGLLFAKVDHAQVIDLPIPSYFSGFEIK